MKPILKLKSICNQIRPFLVKLTHKDFDAAFPQRRWEAMQVRMKSGRIAIGANCNFRRDFQLRVLNGGEIRIGENCFANTNVSITARKSVVIGANSKLANNIVIVDHDHDYRNNLSDYVSEEVVIGEYTWIGANSVILKGTQIGSHCVVAAGTVVRGKFGDHVLIYSSGGKCVSKVIER